MQLLRKMQVVAEAVKIGFVVAMHVTCPYRDFI